MIAASRRCGLNRSYTTATPGRGCINVAVLGSGPAGFYSAHRLMKKLPDARVDVYEQLPVPGGLVRFGVAPDHPEVKNAADTLDLLAQSPNFHFIGNVPVGSGSDALNLSILARHYDALIFAYGASKDRLLGIPGENLRGVLSARAFVGWYNGLPECANLQPDLQSGETAVVIGQGNVALDVARALLAPIDMLRKTDISEYALEALSRNRVREVKVIGRRGPLQAPYTIKELRELMHLPDVSFKPPPEGWDKLVQVDRQRLPRQLKRIAELLEKGSVTAVNGGSRAWTLGYLRTPSAFLSLNNEQLEAVGFEQTAYTQSANDLITGDPQKDLNILRAIRVKPTGHNSLIHASLAFRSIGYVSEPLPGMSEIGVPFDEKAGIIPNDRWGRVLSASERSGGAVSVAHVPGMYCAGWVKRGPTGVIASTMDDAFQTADTLVKDWANNALFNHGDGGGWVAVQAELSKRNVRWVSWDDWKKIDAEERRRGHQKKKEREKITNVHEMLRVIDG